MLSDKLTGFYVLKQVLISKKKKTEKTTQIK